MLINSAWGSGQTVVEGKAHADLYVVEKDIGPELIEESPRGKEFMTVILPGGGTDTVNTPEKLE